MISLVAARWRSVSFMYRSLVTSRAEVTSSSTRICTHTLSVHCHVCLCAYCTSGHNRRGRVCVLGTRQRSSQGWRHGQLSTSRQGAPLRAHHPCPCPHLGLQQQRPRNGQPLLLPATQRVAALPHLCVIPLWQLQGAGASRHHMRVGSGSAPGCLRLEHQMHASSWP